MLASTFTNICSTYTNNTNLTDQLWHDISKAYSSKSRHYHNLDHLTNMLTQLESCRHMVTDWDGVLFALFYHDFIYDPTAKDNEYKSAVEAESKLKAMGVPIDKINHVVKLIGFTKSHMVSSDNDVNLFTDADLSILGSSPAEYEQYRSNVRKEYSIYPDILYKPGRKKVLQHFLDMNSIFKTGFFRDKFESAARTNINSELKSL